MASRFSASNAKDIASLRRAIQQEFDRQARRLDTLENAPVPTPPSGNGAPDFVGTMTGNAVDETNGVQIAHGLGAVPSRFDIYLQGGGGNGLPSGVRIKLATFTDGNSGLSVYGGSTNIGVKASSASVRIVGPSGVAIGTLAINNTFYVYAWR